MRYLTFCFFFLAYGNVVHDLVNDWNYSLYPQFTGPIILLLIMGKIKKKKQETMGIPSQYDIRGIPIVLCGFLLFLISNNTFLFRNISMVTTFIGIVVSLYGLDKISIIWYNLLCLYFSLPIPWRVIKKVGQLFQDITVKLVHIFNVLSFTPSSIEGQIVHFPTISLDIYIACSGIRSLSAMTALALILSAKGNLSRSKRILLVASSIPLTILANSLRIWGMGIVAIFDLSLAMGPYHKLTGEISFLIGFTSLLVLNHFLEKPHVKRFRKV